MVSKTPPTRKRYSPTEKQEILEFVNDYNSKHGRGGTTAALKKFGISQPTISMWLRDQSLTADPTHGTHGTNGTGLKISILNRLVSLDQQIAAKTRELKVLQTRFNHLKSKL